MWNWLVDETKVKKKVTIRGLTLSDGVVCAGVVVPQGELPRSFIAKNLIALRHHVRTARALVMA